MVIINDENNGLGFSFKKAFKKIRLKDVSIKNATKVVKFAAPIVASAVPGGAIATKVMGTKLGSVIKKVANSGIVKKGVALSKTKVGAFAVKQVKSAIGNPTLIKVAPSSQASQVIMQSGEMDEEMGEPIKPVGELTAVKVVSTAQMPMAKEVLPDPQPKDNTMMYLGIAGAVATGIYLYTKK